MKALIIIGLRTF